MVFTRSSLCPVVPLGSFVLVASPLSLCDAILNKWPLSGHRDLPSFALASASYLCPAAFMLCLKIERATPTRLPPVPGVRYQRKLTIVAVAGLLA